MTPVDDPTATIFAAAIQAVATIVGAALAVIGGILLAKRQEQKAQVSCSKGSDPIRSWKKRPG
jgi:hypothetical protein